MSLFLVYAPTAQALYAHVSPEGFSTVWNGTAFETYAVGNWSTYTITLTETQPGCYYGTWPVVSAGYYDFAVYLQLGGSPASTDTFLGGGTDVYDRANTTASTLTYGGLWRLGGANDIDHPTETVEIDDGDTVSLAFSCARMLENRQGVTLTSATIGPVTGLTIGTVSTNTYLAVAQFSGTAGTYTIPISIVLSDATVYSRTRVLTIS